MRLVMAVIQSADATRVVRALTAGGHRVTRFASTGGFLREGNVTLLTGCDNDRVEEVLTVLRREAHTRSKIVGPDLVPPGIGLASDADWVEVPVGGATVFVLDVVQFAHL